METRELLSTLTGLLDSLDTHRTYIARAREQAASGRFSATVIEKVILDHEIKAAGVAEQVGPLLPGIQARLQVLHAEVYTTEASRSSVDEQIMEFELRHVVGELTDGELEQAVADLRGTQGIANERLAVIQDETGTLDAVLVRWNAAAAALGQVPVPVAKPIAPPVSAAPPVAVVAPEIEVDHSKSAPAPSAPALSGLFDDAAEAGDEEVSVGGEVDVSIEGDDAGVEVDVEVMVDAQAAPVEDAPAVETLRRALLVYAEGTPDEHIYPFDGDELNIGRARQPDPKSGRSNDIVLAHDSKVSRYHHARVHRRGNSFYVEDNGSQNGTYLNGDLVTERRLYGGEEVLIGESNFRFRIMD
jgi:hypothetical protein